MQKLRQVHGVGVRSTANEFGCSPSHISRVERGDAKPSRALVGFYEERFRAGGMLLSLLEVVEHAAEQKRQRAMRAGRRQQRLIPGDAAAFIADTIPHGTRMQPGEVFEKTWRIRNAGTVSWQNRQLERQGPLTGPGLISSAGYLPIPNASLGEAITISAILKAPTYECTSIAYFKMIDADGLLCFPDQNSLGLDVLVRVERSTTDAQ
jgi:hypothetical protein